MFIKSFLWLLLSGLAIAQDYVAEDQTPREQHLTPNYAHHHSHHPDVYETARAEPYDFGFQSTDEFGTIMNRQESSDNNGAVRGSYGYTDPHGVFRHVDYVADEHGFRAEVKSNEPGMGTQSPANVLIYAEPPPAGVIVEGPRQHYRPHGHGHVHHEGQAASQQPTRRVPPARPQAARPSYPYIPPQQNPFSTNAIGNTYPSTVSSEFAANQGNRRYYPQYPTYARGPSGASSSAQPEPIVPRPYDGPTYRIGNPHVTDLVRAEKEQDGSIRLPSLVATGGNPTTLVKHIHAYPAAPTTA